MTSKSVCSACRKAAGLAELVKVDYPTLWDCYPLKRLVLELKPPPKKCPRLFEHGVASGMKNA